MGSRCTLTPALIVIYNCIIFSNDDSETPAIVQGFRNLFVEGRSLNISDAVVDGSVSTITISRYNLWDGTSDELQAKSFNPRLTLKVDFMGESGADLGGPRKEFLRLALCEVHSKLTFGPDNNRDLVVQPHYVESRAYYVAGLIIGNTNETMFSEFIN